MNTYRKIDNDTYYIGGNDRQLALFESVYPLIKGVSYNSYLVTDEDCNVLLDTADKAISKTFLGNLRAILGDRKLNYLIVNHMEPDHCALIDDVVSLYPDVEIIGTAKAIQMINQFFDLKFRSRTVKEGDTLETKNHKFTFIMAPMVHWPEVMVTYDAVTKTLYSADAFGTFGALNGNIWADEVDFEKEFLDEARRYYTNIVGKYGKQVQTLLGKASKIDIQRIFPLHGPLWRKDLSWFISKYVKWSTYEAESDDVLIIYGSVYKNTENAVEILASMLADRGIKNIHMYDVSTIHPSFLVSEAFKYKNIVIASSTYNAEIFTPMENVLMDLKYHALANRNVIVIENGSWAISAGKKIVELLKGMSNMNILNDVFTIKSSLKENQMDQLSELADLFTRTCRKADEAPKAPGNPLWKIPYGLYVTTAKEGDKENGCITNTLSLVADKPETIMFSINKNNLTAEMVKNTGKANFSILTTSTNFEMIKHFGFQSGRNVEKLQDYAGKQYASNGIPYIVSNTNGYISVEVIRYEDLGSHYMFTAKITESKAFNDDETLTYEFYQKNIKPCPQKPKVKGWVCKVCGYVYEGEELPPDFVCPLCNHGAEYFEPIE